MKTRKSIVVALVVAVPALIAGSAFGAGRIIHVDARAPGANDGSSWENAYVFLQDALAAADVPAEPVEIRVAQGIQRPDRGAGVTRGDSGASFHLISGVTLAGGYAGYGATNPNTRNMETYQSVLSGDLAANDIELPDLQWQTLFDYAGHGSRADNSYTVVTGDGTDETAVLEGFTITGGNTGHGREAREDALSGAGMFCREGHPTLRQCTFYRNTGYCARIGEVSGAGMANVNSSPTLVNCTFTENIAFGYHAGSMGGAMFNCDNSFPTLVECVFHNNIVTGFGGWYEGGAIYDLDGALTLTRCTFTGNAALEGKGGALSFRSSSHPILTDCIFKDNEADSGGAIYAWGHASKSIRPQLMNCVFQENFADYGGAIHHAQGVAATVTACVFLQNSATHFGRGGAVYNGPDCHPTFSRCFFGGNAADGDGGAMYDGSEPTLANCAFSGNTARRGGAFYAQPSTDAAFTNCTFTANEAHTGGAAYNDEGVLDLRNCILWSDTPEELYTVNGLIEVTFSDVQGGWFGAGNINAEPQFADVAGVDGVIGTEDDNLRLSVASPCIDAGDSTVVSPEMATDLDGKRRIAKRDIDMGAYEFDGPFDYYVDSVNGSDTNGGWSPQDALATIQKGIDSAPEGYSVMVAPGVYHEAIDFRGKAITVTGMHGAPVLRAPDEYAVSFYSAEGPDSVLQNFAIANSEVGIFVSGSSPTIRNVTLAGNGFGIAAYAGANPDISNCILSGNTEGDLFGCSARFSCVEQGAEGRGNISDPPLFADPAGGDYHLLSERGRYVSAHGLWAFDTTTSPCIDSGDPDDDLAAERMPNGGRINMGAFGGTAEASVSEWPLVGDLNRDGIVDLRDLTMVFEHWLEALPTASVVDTTAPQPDPAQWDLDALPREVLGAGGGPFDYAVQMKAVQAVDPSGPVEYFFECYERPDIVPDGFSSGWQTDRSYTVAVGRMGQGYRFRVRARDQCGNETQWSSVERTTSAPPARR